MTAQAETNESVPTGDQTNQIADPTFGRKVFVGNLSYKTNYKLLKEGFSSAGTVERVNIIVRRGKFGFVQFAEEAGAQKAIETLNDTELNGRTIKVELSRPTRTKRPSPAAKPASKPKENPTPRKPRKPKRVRIPDEEREVSDDVVYIREIPDGTTKDDLNELFKDFGATLVRLQRMNIRVKGERIKKTFAFITVDSAENQQKAIDSLNGKEFKGQTLTVLKAFKPLPVVEVKEEEVNESAEATTPTSKPKKKKRKSKPKSKKPAGDAEEAKVDAAEGTEGQSDSKPKTKKPRNRKPKKTSPAKDSDSPKAQPAQSTEAKAEPAKEAAAPEKTE